MAFPKLQGDQQALKYDLRSTVPEPSTLELSSVLRNNKCKVKGEKDEAALAFHPKSVVLWVRSVEVWGPVGINAHRPHAEWKPMGW